MKSGPLTGKRIVVTRAARQGGGLQDRLAGLGAEVILLPTIEIVPPDSYAPLDDALQHAAEFDWLVVTSANAVRVIQERLMALGIPPIALSRWLCAAIGRATADALPAIGLNADVVPDYAVGESLADALTDCVRGARVLLVRAAAARDVVPDALAAEGVSVTVVDAYRTISPADTVERTREVFGNARLPDAVVFTSGSTVTHLVDALRAARIALPPEIACISIGPVTSTALREAGIVVAAQAEEASLEGLIGALRRLYAR
jgi:uroporphyrinogen-III synthase